MRELVWAVIGLLFGLRSVMQAQRDVRRLRATGETFGIGRLTKFSLVIFLGACASSALWWIAARQFEEDLTVLSFGFLISVGVRLILIDTDTHLLPSGIVYRAIALAIPLLMLASLNDSKGSIATMFLGALIMWTVMKTLEVLSRGDLGGGDVRLALLLGPYTGWLSLEHLAIAVVMAFAAAGLFALLLIVLRRAGRRTHIAFGPFLIAGALFAVLR
jgi:leader peptidase (prepilin peptidase) / N-methyltransferase